MDEQLSDTILSPINIPPFFAEHDAVWSAMLLGSAGLSCSSCVPSHLTRSRRGLDAVLSNPRNIPVLASLPSTHPKHSPVLAAVEKISGTPARTSAGIWLTPCRCKIFTSGQDSSSCCCCWSCSAAHVQWISKGTAEEPADSSFQQDPQLNELCALELQKDKIWKGFLGVIWVLRAPPFSTKNGWDISKELQYCQCRLGSSSLDSFGREGYYVNQPVSLEQFSGSVNA